jgi:2,5-diamino-6-(ribosylamino)-4(3H)-pyrimidinone 5'-phosphate reductase
MLPYVILHIGISADGRIDWGLGSDNPYYELVPQLSADTDISGSNTILKAEFPDGPQKAFGEVYDHWAAMPSRPILAVVDSKGKIKNWHMIKEQPWWRDYLSLCSAETPKEHLEYLQEEEIKYIIAGERQVDLRQALEWMNEKVNSKRVRIDSGGILNGVMLRQGLVDEVSIVISPSLVGGTSPKTLFVAQDLMSEEGVIPLTLISMERLKERYVWLRYKITSNPNTLSKGAIPAGP